MMTMFIANIASTAAITAPNENSAKKTFRAHQSSSLVLLGFSV